MGQGGKEEGRAWKGGEERRDKLESRREIGKKERGGEEKEEEGREGGLMEE